MELQWMAIYTKPRSEKKVAERIERLGLEVYCPLQNTIRQWSDRKKKVKVPIFPSYVFVNINERDRPQILSDPGVLNFVFWQGKPAIIRNEEIDTIKQLLDENSENEIISIHQYQKGDEVDIIAGPFQQLKGIVDIVEKTKVTILIESLGMVVRIQTKLGYINK